MTVLAWVLGILVFQFWYTHMAGREFRRLVATKKMPKEDHSLRCYSRGYPWCNCPSHPTCDGAKHDCNCEAPAEFYQDLRIGSWLWPILLLKRGIRRAFRAVRYPFRMTYRGAAEFIPEADDE